MKGSYWTEIDDDGNYYDPLSQRLDNDGMKDRNDKYRDKVIFESTL